jgi:bacterioferritin-associated ferredoxin
VPGISILGDAAGIAGAEIAGLSGSIGGLRIASALTGRDGQALEEKIRPLRAGLRRYRRGRAFLDALYLPAQRQRTGGPDAIVCRCEEITGRQVTETARALKVSGPNQMKVFLRTGMGPCQGRYCGATVAELIAAERGLPLSEVGYLHLRTPARPLTLGELATVPSTDAEMASVY